MLNCSFTVNSCRLFELTLSKINFSSLWCQWYEITQRGISGTFAVILQKAINMYYKPIRPEVMIMNHPDVVLHLPSQRWLAELVIIYYTSKLMSDSYPSPPPSHHDWQRSQQVSTNFYLFGKCYFRAQWCFLKYSKTVLHNFRSSYSHFYFAS